MNPNLDREALMDQARVEARAKVIWGDSPKKVIFFLRTKGIPMEEAMQITDEAFEERKAALRSKAWTQVFVGLPLVALPLGGFAVFSAIGSLSMLAMLIFGLTCAAGLYGLYSLVSGIWSLCVPKDPDEESIDEM
jgi:hypothetical protein